MPFGNDSDDPSHVRNIERANRVWLAARLDNGPEQGFAQWLWIPGPLPGLNDMVGSSNAKGGNVWASIKLKKQWIETINLLARSQGFNPVKCGRFHYSIRETHQRRDPSNFCAGAVKIIEDALQAAGLLESDGWRGVKGLSFDWSVEEFRPGVFLSVTDAELWEASKNERENRGERKFRRGSSSSKKLRKALARTARVRARVGLEQTVDHLRRERGAGGKFVKSSVPGGVTGSGKVPKEASGD
jgi:hypothetical protein